MYLGEADSAQLSEMDWGAAASMFNTVVGAYGNKVAAKTIAKAQTKQAKRDALMTATQYPQNMQAGINPLWYAVGALVIIGVIVIATKKGKR